MINNTVNQSSIFGRIETSYKQSERPSGLAQAIIEVGRINKTLYLLNYIGDKITVGAF